MITAVGSVLSKLFVGWIFSLIIGTLFAWVVQKIYRCINAWYIIEYHRYVLSVLNVIAMVLAFSFICKPVFEGLEIVVITKHCLSVIYVFLQLSPLVVQPKIWNFLYKINNDKLKKKN